MPIVYVILRIPHASDALVLVSLGEISSVLSVLSYGDCTAQARPGLWQQVQRGGSAAPAAPAAPTTAGALLVATDHR